MTGSNCLMCGHAALKHHTWSDPKKHYGRGPCWSAVLMACRCQHYVGRDKAHAALVLRAHGMGSWSGL
jgi:hypothetical protein